MTKFMKYYLSLILLLVTPFMLGAQKPVSGQPEGEIEHKETIYKDLTGDGVVEKLVFAYSGPDIRLLDVSFRIYQIDPKTKQEKAIFSDQWNTWDIYNDAHGPQATKKNVRYYITDFFGRICFASSKDNMCQAKCSGLQWCTEKEIKHLIVIAIMGAEKYNQWYDEKRKAFQNDWNAMDENQKLSLNYGEEFEKTILSSEPVNKEKIEKIFKEIFINNELSCFGYEPYFEALQAYVWSPSLNKFISIGGCYWKNKEYSNG